MPDSPVIVLGLSAFYHDSAAALMIDGVIVAAAQEDRFSRRKHDPSLPVPMLQLQRPAPTRNDFLFVLRYLCDFLINCAFLAKCNTQSIK